MSKLNEGLNTWRFTSNHNHMMKLQRAAGSPSGDTVELAFFGSSAFRITTPASLTVMIDPWRNFPHGKWDWYFADMPVTAVDIGVSTHAHFDHDALHLLDANVFLDRLIGTYEFADVKITGIADKHATDFSEAVYDAGKLIQTFSSARLSPPDNDRSWDNCLIIVETAGVRILHWGDNRPDPPEEVWDAIGEIDIALLPADDSRHVMGFAATQSIIDRLSPKVVVPHHYYIWDVLQRQSTLQPCEQWLTTQPNVHRLAGPATTYSRAALDALPDPPRTDYFADHVAFDKAAWHTAIKAKAKS
jgi:L-ascorbate metabolism protein UlaG (beta-lactamase superfamily)